MYMYSCFSLLLIQCLKQKNNKNNLNVAKCTLGKVNLAAMLVSSFPNSAGGGQPDAFSWGHLVTCISNCLLAVLRTVCALEPCSLLANFCAVFFSSPPSLFSSGPGKGKKHIGW